MKTLSGQMVDLEQDLLKLNGVIAKQRHGAEAFSDRQVLKMVQKCSNGRIEGFGASIVF